MTANFYCDPRLGGCPRFILSEKDPIVMFVPDEVLQCVVFLGRAPSGHPDKRVWKGTAFLIGVSMGGPDMIVDYLVTAKHCIDAIRNPLTSHDCTVYVRFNTVAGGTEVFASDPNDWTFHPSDSSVDVAVLPCNPSSAVFNLRHLPAESFCTKDIMSQFQVGVGDEVFITGLFTEHTGQKRSAPIVRTGNIAAIPGEPVWTSSLGEMDAFLIESRSIGGLSGSPVFVVLDPLMTIPLGHVSVRTGSARNTGAFRLLGLVHGHWDSGPLIDVDGNAEDAGGDRKGVNMGIAIVVPAAKILEVINHPKLIKAREEALQGYLRNRPSPTPD